MSIPKTANFELNARPMKFQLSGPPAGLPHSRKKLLVKASETHCSCWIIRAGHIRGDIPYTYKVLLRVAQSCDAKRATLG